MAENQNYIGVAMGLDVSDLKAGLSEANKQIQLANSKFKAAASGMDDWTKSAEGLSAKIEQLDTVLKMQQAKLAGLKAEYAKVAAEQGENSEAARRLQVQINNQQAVVNRTEKEYKNYKETLKGVKDGSIDLEKTSLKAGKAVEKAGKQAEDAGDGFTIAKGAVAGFIANGLSAMVSAAGNAIKNVLGLADATREYRKTLATIDTAAEDVGVSTDFIRDKFTNLMGVLQDDAGVSEGLNNLLTAGFDEKTLDGITASLEGAALKWKDTLKFEGIADSLQEWIGSGGESLTGNFAELLERMGYNLDEVKEKTAGMTDEQRRNYAANLLASEGLTEVSENYRAQNADMIAAQEANIEYQNSMAELGAVTEPIMTAIRQGMTDLLNAIIQLVSGGDMEALKTGIDNAFKTFKDEILPVIIDGIKWLIDHFDEVTAGVAGIGAAFLAWKVVSIIQGVIKAFKAWTLATQGQTVAQRLLNLAMKANPIGIVISLIAGLVTAFVLLWNKSEGFRNFFIGMWESIKKIGSSVADFIGKIFETKINTVKGIINGVISLINGAIRGINKIKIPDWDIFGSLAGKGINIPEIPKLYRGGILKKGQVGLLEGKGAEKILPLEEETGWIKKIAAQLAKDITGVKGNAASLAYGKKGNNGRGNTNINAPLTVNYNGKLSRKELKRTENNHYKAIKMKLKAEGVV